MASRSFSYEPVTFADLPGWGADAHLEAYSAFCASAPAVIDRDGDAIDGLAKVARWALDQQNSISTSVEARSFFEQAFVPARVIHDGPRGQLTGYYEPVISGSLTHDQRYTVPIYRRPPDLENVVAESARAGASDSFSHMRRTSQGLEPYATREEIESGALADLGLELLFLADPVEAFFLHVQGSGAIALPDGRLQRITYDGKNGHPYTSVGRTMIDDGVLAAADLTLQTMGDWLRAHTEQARTILWRNKSFVFFRLLAGDAPIGVLGTPLHPLRSLALDTSYHELGVPVYVSAPTLLHVGQREFHRLMVAHDVGSAIKGPERGDIFFGTGDAALCGAGITKHHGRFHVLLPVVSP